jgi:phenylacetate-CoA ligase
MKKFFNPFQLSDLLFGTSIFMYYKELKGEELLSRNEILAIQNQKLMDILNHASKNVPFYESQSIILDQSKSALTQLQLFPIVNKKQINNDLNLFCVTDLNINKVTTLFSGGSSGNPGKVYVNKEDHSKMRARILQLWGNAGYELGNPILQLGMSKSRTLLKKLKDLSMNVTYELAFKINEDLVKQVLTKKTFKKNTIFIGYASGLYSYARNAEKMNLDVQFKCVISLGDKMFDHYRETIERVFKTKVYDTYGSNEGFVIGGQHVDGNYYLNETHVFVEIVDENYSPVKDGEIGRALVTCLDNFTMPLIRFDLGDILAINSYSNQNPLPFKTIKKIIGRDVDIIKTKNGYSLIVHFFTAIFGRIIEIEQFRIVQETIERIIIEYIPGIGFDEKILAEIERKILEELPENEIFVYFKSVTNIPPSGSGKPQIIKSMIN